MSIRELIRRVGQTGLTGQLAVERSLKVAVRILDCREVYGRTDYLVEPLAGEGQQWVSAERVQHGAVDTDSGIVPAISLSV